MLSLRRPRASVWPVPRSPGSRRLASRSTLSRGVPAADLKLSWSWLPTAGSGANAHVCRHVSHLLCSGFGSRQFGVGLLGLLGSFRGVPLLVAWLSGGEVARPAAAVSQTLMAVACAVFVALAVRSFVTARRARAAGS
jgi:hypothetical protein